MISFRSIRYLLTVSLLVLQTAHGQDQTSLKGSSASQTQNDQDRKAERPSGNGEGSINEEAPVQDPLLNLLVSKGLLTTEEARAILSSRNPQSQRDQLASLLKDKGLISAAEFAQLRTTASSNAEVTAAMTSPDQPAGRTSAPGPPRQTPPAPSVIAAVAPVRLLPIDVPQREGLIPDLKPLGKARGVPTE